MKKSILLTLAALAMIFTQCKKAESVVPQGGTAQGGETIEISLNINKNSKVIVDPGSTVASVTFQTGDVIHVASDGKYSGTLTCDGGIFKGTIVKPSKGSTMYFYFLGNKSVTDADGNALSTTTGSESTTMMVNISDQSSALPVISYGTATYNETTTEYSATLRNKCGLVKFTTSDYTGSGTLSVKKMNNKVTVVLAGNTFTPGKVTDDGVITLNKASDGVYWAILLPQESVEGSKSGDAFSSDSWAGIYGAVPAITANSYVNAGVAISNDPHQYVDFGLPSGTLWATCNVGADSPEEYGDYFAWGEIEPYYINGAWNTEMTTGAGNSVNPSNGYKWVTYSQGETSAFTEWNTKPYNTSTNILTSDRDAATANWGGSWRMPTKDEWLELYNNTTSEWTTQNNVYGRKFTGKASGYTDKSIFLPAAGERINTNLSGAGSYGYYWSSTRHSNQSFAYNMRLNSSVITSQHNSQRYYGFTVRPVQ